MKTTLASPTRRSATGRVQIAIAAVVVALLGSLALTVAAQPAPPPGMGMDHGPGHGMHGGGMMFGGSPERMGRMLDRMLDGLNATDAQRTQIKQIAASAAADLKAQAASGRGLRQRGMQIFTAPTVDAAAAEQLRQQMLQQRDVMSKRVTQAMLAIANVLTPEQRAKIGQRMMDRQARVDERMKRELPR